MFVHFWSSCLAHRIEKKLFALVQFLSSISYDLPTCIVMNSDLGNKILSFFSAFKVFYTDENLDKDHRIIIFKSSYWRCSVKKKVFLKISLTSQENTRPQGLQLY